MNGAISALGAFAVAASLAFPFVYGCLLQRPWLAFAAAWVAAMGVAMAGGAAAEAAAKPHPGALFWSFFGVAALATAAGVVRLMFGEWPAAQRLAAPETAGVVWALQAGSAWLILAWPMAMFVAALSGDPGRSALEATAVGRAILALQQFAVVYPFVFLICYALAWLAWWLGWKGAAAAASCLPFAILAFAFAGLAYATTLDAEKTPPADVSEPHSA